MLNPLHQLGWLASRRNRALLCAVALFLVPPVAFAQIDPMARNQVQLGFDQPVTGRGPQAVYAYYYLGIPELTHSNLALRLAVAPVYLAGELGIRRFLFEHTGLGLGVYGGGFGNNYYEVRQGDYLRGQSFYGYGGGGEISLYQRLNPAQLVPLHLVARGGYFYSTYADTSDTDDDFTLPASRNNLFTRVGLRLAGRQPRLYPDIGMELSVWFEQRWRLQHGSYGYSGDRSVNATASLYWLYGGLSYAWTNIGHRFSFGVTAGGSESADRFSAWRLGGVLPLVSEFPLMLPGYYYQEISAEGFVHLTAAYAISLDSRDCWQLRAEAAGARIDYLPGFEQPNRWQVGAGVGLVYTFPSKAFKIAVRYGYGFNALRDGSRGANSIGVLFQYDFEAGKPQRSLD